MRNASRWTLALIGLVVLATGLPAIPAAEAGPGASELKQERRRGGRQARLERLEAMRRDGDWRWAVPTEHYDLLSDAPRERTILYGRVLESMFTTYERVFQFDGELEEPFVVQIYANQDQFIAGTGSGHGVGGFYDYEKIVTFYDHNMHPFDTVDTLLHEGTHQFEDLVLPDMRSMAMRDGTWLIEGLATYFEAAEYEDGHLRIGEVNYDRLRRLKQGVLRDDYIPLRELLETPQPSFGTTHYEHAWALIHFLLHGHGGDLRDEFMDMWETVKEGENAARALEGAFPDHDLDEIEEAWKEYVLNVR